MEQSLLKLASMNTERRRKGRIIQKMVVQFPEHSKLRLAELLNLSGAGMFIKGELPLSHGERLEFMFFLKDLNSWIRGSAQVRWCRRKPVNSHFPEGMGLEFIDLPKETSFILN